MSFETAVVLYSSVSRSYDEVRSGSRLPDSLRAREMVVGLVFLCSLFVTVLAANCVEFVRSARYSVTNVTCTSDMDCIPAHSSCYQRTFCACNEGFVPINKTRRNNFQCVPAATKEGDLCVHDLQCENALGLHAECTMYREGSPGEGFGSCHCKAHHHLVGKLCHPNSYIGDSCRVSDDCYLKRTDGNVRAYCDKSVCICPPGRHPSSDRKECLANEGIDGPCDDEDDCIFPHTRCAGAGFCNCDEGYVMNEDRTACEAEDTLKPRAKLGDKCTNSSQCSAFLKESMCHPVFKTCSCSIGAQQVNDTCYRIARLGNRCYERLECVAPSGENRTDCVGTVCTCVAPYKPYSHDCLLQSEVHQRVGSSSSKIQVAALTLITWLFLL